MEENILSLDYAKNDYEKVKELINTTLIKSVEDLEELNEEIEDISNMNDPVSYSENYKNCKECKEVVEIYEIISDISDQISIILNEVQQQLTENQEIDFDILNKEIKEII